MSIVNLITCPRSFIDTDSRLVALLEVAPEKEGEEEAVAVNSLSRDRSDSVWDPPSLTPVLTASEQKYFVILAAGPSDFLFRPAITPRVPVVVCIPKVNSGSKVHFPEFSLY